ncbi:neutral/alkaline non-lysosomal ceramidase N-terminal domain-containing protein [Paenibacillus sp. HJGM_3]|uniref:neutral/alkaline non-lysosomal ceramidase N-terminal domain-containing protein n=1 Tax=Paenibacillus sp. HJGM_3 TaxID=3379816 RepID=UPI00385BF44D
MSASAMLMGVSKVDITPLEPIPLAGFGNRTGPYEAISSRLYLRANAFRQQVNGQDVTALVVEADIIWWGPERMAGIRGKLLDRFGIRPEHVILSASHTHGGPQTTTQFVDMLGLPDAGYMDQLEDWLLQAVGAAISTLEPVSIERGSGTCQVGINRRKWVNGAMVMAPNPDNYIDTNVEVFRFTAESGATKAVWMHYTCHPTVTNLNQVNSDYSGAAMAMLEQSIGGGTVVSFLQGCCGDTRPALFRDDKFYSGDAEDVRRLGRMLADAVTTVLGRPMKPVPPGKLGGRLIGVDLPYLSLPSEEEIAATENAEGLPGQWSVKLRRNPQLLTPSIPLQLSRLDIADGMSFIAMDGEMVLEYSEKVKRLSGGRALALGYSNGMIGYVPTAKQVEEGGYEGRDSSKLFMLPAVFDPRVETVIEQGIQELLQGTDHH